MPSPNMDAGQSSEETSAKADLACLVCRSRKVRCDRTLPSCNACIRLGVTCPQYDRDSEFISRKEIQKSTESIFKAAGVEKRRVGSCAQCRTSKHRCTQTRPSCRRCILRGLSCAYPEKGDRARSLPVASSPSHSDVNKFPKRPIAASSFGVDIKKLQSDTLPEDPGLRRRLVERFFDRSYPIRCLNFLHKPSFLHSLDRASVVQDYGEPLLYAMCALAARSIYYDGVTPDGPSARPSEQVPGRAWADRARKEVLAEIHAPTLQHLMTMVLLCDYGLREDQNALVFVLVACLHRVIILLGLDGRPSLDSSATPSDIVQRETENRLVWACFFVDQLLKTGVDKNSCWRDTSPDIPLHSPEKAFQLSMPSELQTLTQLEPPDAKTLQGLDYPVISIIILRLRSEVLKLIRCNDANMPIASPSCRFSQLIRELEAMQENLPEKYILTPENIQVLREQRILGGVACITFLLHAALFDLTRIALPGFSFPLAAAFRNAPLSFRRHCQLVCRKNAHMFSRQLRECMAHGHMAFDDIFCADAALESGKIQLVYTATIDQSPRIVQATRENLSASLKFLGSCSRTKGTAIQFIRTLLSLCTVFGFRDIVDKYKEQHSDLSEVAEVTGSAEVHHLSVFAPLRRARSEIQGSSSSSSIATSSATTQASPVAHASHGMPPSAKANPESVTGTFQQPLPIIRPAEAFTSPQAHYKAPTSTHPNVFLSEQPQRNPMQLIPSAGAMINGAILQPSAEDYIQTAEYLSGYITWNIPNIPDMPPS